jgi:hypothetical protein
VVIPVLDGSPAVRVYQDGASIPKEGKAKLGMVHAAPDVDFVDMDSWRSVDPFTDLGFPNASDYEEVPAGTCALKGKTAGADGAAFTSPEVTFSAGTVYSAFTVGQAEDEAFTIKLAEDRASGDGRGTISLLNTVGISPVHLLLPGNALIALSGGCVAYGRRLDETRSQESTKTARERT